jgi:hypothetical protein
VMIYVIRSKKRSFKEDKINQPQKRVRTTVSRTRNADNSRDSSIRPHTGIVQQLPRTISDTERGVNAEQKDMQLKDLISYSERSGRAVRLPTRFR